MKNELVLKSVKSVVMITLLSTLGFVSCSKDDDSNDTSATITEEEVVDVVESSLAKDSNGMSKTMETTVVTAEEDQMLIEQENTLCGETTTNSFNQSATNGSYSYNYDISTSYTLSCTIFGFPTSLNFEASTDGQYATPRVTSDDTSTLDWTVSNLSPINANVVFNGQYERNGTQVSLVRNMNTFESTLTLNLSSVSVNKTTYEIESGTATLNFVGISSTGAQYNFTGSITFNGNGTATVIINGNSYTINL